MRVGSIAYGVRDGQLVHVSQVERGLACACRCVECGGALVARKGKVQVHHFGHASGAECVNAAETALHLLGKQIVANLSSIQIPPYLFSKKRRTRDGELVLHTQTVARGGTVPIGEAWIEVAQGSFTPDVILRSGQKSLLIEIYVTHKVDTPKRRKIRAADLPMIEIRLDPEDALLSPEVLTAKLRDDTRSKSWIFHPDQRAAEDTFFKMLRAAARSERERRRRARSAQRASRTRAATTTPVRVKPKAIANGPMLRELPDEKTVNKFFRDHGRYPTLEEGVALAYENSEEARQQRAQRQRSADHYRRKKWGD